MHSGAQQGKSSEDRNRVTLLRILGAAFLANRLLMMYIWSWFVDMGPLKWIVLRNVIGVTAFLTLAQRFRLYRTFSWLLMILIPGALAGLAYQGGIYALNLSPACYFPTVMALLFGPKFAIAAAGTVILAYIGAYQLHGLGTIFPATYPSYDYANMFFVAWGLEMPLAILMASYFENSRNFRLRALQKTQREAEDANNRMFIQMRKLRSAIAQYSHEIRTPLNVILAMADSTVDLPEFAGSPPPVSVTLPQLPSAIGSAAPSAPGSPPLNSLSRPLTSHLQQLTLPLLTIPPVQAAQVPSEPPRLQFHPDDVAQQQEREHDVLLLQSAVHSLLALSSNVLDTCAMEADALRIEQDDFNLYSLLREMVKSTTFAAQQNNLQFSLEMSSEVPSRVIGDGLRVRQVLYNLLSNAIKFTTEGGQVILSVRICEAPLVAPTPASSTPASPTKFPSAPEQKLWLEFTVHDTGSGVEMEHLFSKVKAIAGDAHSVHSSLGLYMSRKLIQRMGGTISLANRVGHGGTIASVRLPFGASRRSASKRSMFQSTGSILEPEPAEPVKPLHILYADDEPANHFVITTHLRSTPHTLVTVDNGLEAVDAFRSQKYDLVLLDIEMPVMNGVQAMLTMRTIEQQTHAPRTPMVFITAHASPEFAQLDVDNVMPKPISRAWLLEYVDSVTKQAAAAEAAAIADKFAPHHATPTKPLHRKGSSSTLDGLPWHKRLRNFASRVWSRVASVIFLPSGIETDLVLAWKYRVMSFYVGFMLLMRLPRAFTAQTTFWENVAMLVLISSYAGFLVLMRLQWKRMLAVYFPVQQLLLLFGMGIWNRHGLRVLQMGGGGPPIVAMMVDVSTTTTVLTSGLVLVCALLMHYFLPATPVAHIIANEPDYLFNSVLYRSLLVVQVTVTLLYSERCRRVAFAYFTTSIVEVRKTERKSKAKKEATEQFAQSVAYGFRTPLSVVIGLAEVLEAQARPFTPMERHMRAMRAACQFLSNMMQETLKVASESTTSFASSIKIRPLILSTVRMVLFQARSKQVSLRVHIDASVPEHISHDRTQLERSLLRLLAHSIKFTKSSTILVHFSVIGRGPAVIDVDGMDREHVGLVFNGADDEGVPDELHVHPTVVTPGSNVGLAKHHVMLCCSVEEAADAVSSTPLSPRTRRDGHMSGVFSSKLMQSITEQVTRQLADVADSRHTLTVAVKTIAPFEANVSISRGHWSRTLNILIVDDNTELQYVLQLSMRNTPHMLTLASTGPEALFAMQHESYDCVLLSMELQDTPCAQLIQKMRAQVAATRPYILCISSIFTPSNRKHIMDAGADAFEERPMPRARLFGLLYQLAASSATSTASTTSNHSGATSRRVSNAQHGIKSFRDVASRWGHMLAGRQLALQHVEDHSEYPEFAIDRAAAKIARAAKEERGRSLSARISRVVSRRNSPTISTSQTANSSTPTTVLSTARTRSPAGPAEYSSLERMRSAVGSPLFPMQPTLAPGTASFEMESLERPTLLPSRSASRRGSFTDTAPVDAAAQLNSMSSGESLSSGRSSNESFHADMSTASPFIPAPRSSLNTLSRPMKITFESADLTPLAQFVTSADCTPATSTLFLDVREDNAAVVAMVTPPSADSTPAVPIVTAVSTPPASAVFSARQSLPSAEVSAVAAAEATAKAPVIAQVSADMFEYVRDTYIPQLHQYAADMITAAAKDDIVSVRGFAHKISGTAGAFGLDHISSYSKQVTKLCHADPFVAEALRVCLLDLKQAVGATALECLPEEDDA